MMDKPKIMACLIPLLFSCLVKKETVIGIIGKTQGVIKAVSQAKKAVSKSDQIDSPLLDASSFIGAPFCGSVPLADSFES